MLKFPSLLPFMRLSVYGVMVIGIALLWALLPRSALSAVPSIPLTVHLAEAVTVNTTGGTPRIAVDVGGLTRYADYTSGSGSSALVFTYTATAGDVDLDGISLSSPIQLNGGTIKDTSGNDAILTFTAPNTSNVKVNNPSLGMDFIADSDGRYTLNGTAYNDLGSFLTATGGSFTRASVGTYFDSSGTLQTALSDTARFDYAPATHVAKGILIEESRTNLFLYSQQLTNPSWTARAITVIPNSGLSPDGANNAFLFTGTNQFAALYATTPLAVTASTSYTISAFLKAGSSSTAVLVVQGANSVYGTYTLSGAGASSVNASGFTSPVSSISSIGNGWYRCSVKFTIPASGVTTIRPEIWLGLYNGTNNAGQTMYVWGPQLEQGSFATSYIPTTTSTVTRAADILTFPLSSWFSASEGTAFVQADFFGSNVVGGVFALNDGQVNSLNRVDLRAGQAQSFISSSGSHTNLAPFSFPSGASQKISITYSSTIAASSQNGAAALTGSPLVPVGMNKLWIGNIDHGIYWLDGHVARFKYYPLAMTASKLQLLTQ